MTPVAHWTPEHGMAAIDRARRAWERSQPQLFIELYPDAQLTAGEAGAAPPPTTESDAGWPVAASRSSAPAVSCALEQADAGTAGVPGGVGLLERDPAPPSSPPGSGALDIHTGGTP